eukprot:5009479-Pyramimonas_sp.AAC.1
MPHPASSSLLNDSSLCALSRLAHPMAGKATRAPIFLAARTTELSCITRRMSGMLSARSRTTMHAATRR